ncbi:hypothetical protein [Staphylococcus pasteuri]|uniref:hypothetical protein n=1 Tax=Staphylococcus pasteuri TaxID=45972 RepID=UPI0012B8A2BF|nr:hypothetical protein [Staphylococcus pasteuri]
MVQGFIGGQTPYNHQSLTDIQKDIHNWQVYSKEMNKQFVVFIADHYERISQLPLEVKQLFEETVQTTATFIGDFEIIKSHIESGNITKSTIDLLINIGKMSNINNVRYGKAWNNNNINFEENEDIYRNLYCDGRDFFVTLEDAVNASERLNHYINTSPIQLTQNTFNATGKYIQQANQSSVHMTNNNNSEKINELIEKLFSELKNNDDTSEETTEIKELIEGVQEEANKDQPKKSVIKNLLNTLSTLNNVSAGFLTNINELMKIFS